MQEATEICGLKDQNIRKPCVTENKAEERLNTLFSIVSVFQGEMVINWKRVGLD